MRPPFALALATAAALALPGSAEAKDLRNRFGIGFDSQLGEIPAASVKYTFPASDKAINIAVEALAGLKMPATGDTGVLAGGRFLYTVLAEDQMNLFVGLGGFYVGSNTLDGQFQGFRGQTLLGAEFFLYGLDNLGLTLQVGVNVDLGDEVPGVSTTASSLGGLGLHYYF